MARTAVILANMGGPDSLEAVKPFLENIFNDPDIIDIPVPEFFRSRLVKTIIKKRLPESLEIYRRIGGKSPLLKISLKQARLLEENLNQHNDDEHRVFVAMRYWKPFFEEVWNKILADRFDRVIVLSQYPQYSSTTTGSFENLLAKLSQNARKFHGDVEFIRSYCDFPGYIHAITDQIRSTMVDTILNKKTAHLILSAHGIPIKRIKQGDPYRKEIARSFDAVRHLLPDHINMHLAYQSKVGPVKWLGPDIQDVLRKLARKNVNEVFVYPISFVTDNSETVYEIDILYRKLALKLGFNSFTCIPALNTSPRFITAMARIIYSKTADRSVRRMSYV